MRRPETRFISIVFCFGAIATVLTPVSASPPETPFLSAPARAQNEVALNAAVISPSMSEALDGAYYAQLDLNALSVTRNARIPAAVRGIPGQRIRVNLPFRNCGDILIIESVETDNDTRSLAGRVEGEPSSAFTITMEGAAILGKIHLGRYLYVLEELSNSQASIVKRIDKRRIPAAAYLDDGIESPLSGEKRQRAVSAKKQQRREQSIAALKSLPENGNVRVLFLYTPDVQNRNNISTLTSNIVAEFNSSARNSGIAGEYYLTKAGTELVNDNFEGECRDDILTYMQLEEGVFAGLNDVTLPSYDADYALLLITAEPGDPDACYGNGGRVGGKADIFDPNDPISLSTDEYAIGDLTAIHESGHVLGGYHANYDGGPKRAGIPAYAEGWAIDDSDPMQTMMGGYRVCDFDGLPATCERIPYWSDPQNFENGHYIGDSTSHMSGALPGSSTEPGTMGQVAAWEPYTYSRPNTPSNLSVQSEQCYGQNSVNWASSSNTQQYQLLKSTSSSFTNSEVIYSGSSTSTWVNVTSGTWYLRVRACNGSGCSDTSVQRSASYYNGCN